MITVNGGVGQGNIIDGASGEEEINQISIKINSFKF